MVTVRNDIEMMAAAAATPDGTKVKDVNLKQEAKPAAARRRSYRCITIVGVVTVVLLSLAVGSIFLFEHVLNGIPTENSGDGSPSSTVAPEQREVHQQSVPAFADPFDRPADPEIPLDPVDSEEIDIDGTPSTSSTTETTRTTPEDVVLIDEGSGGADHDDDDDDDNEDEYHYSGSGDDVM